MWVLYVLLMLFLGLLIGGFASGNITLGIVGTVLLGIDVIIGIAIKYRQYKSNEKKLEEAVKEVVISHAANKMNHLQEVTEKLQRIKQIRGAQERFTHGELSDICINLLDAKSRLSREEYECVWKLYRYFQDDCTRNTLMDYGEYPKYCDEVISYFDMVAPYYKFCGYDSVWGRLADEGKELYRSRAREFIQSGAWIDENSTRFFGKKILSTEWEVLNLRFRKEFYPHTIKAYSDDEDGSEEE